MSFTERVAQKQAGNLPPSKVVHLDHLDEDVVVRAMMAGSQVRAQALGPDIQSIAMVAFSVESPDAPGVPAWNWNDLTHRQQIESLHPDDFLKIIEAQTQLSGWGESDAQLLGKSGSKGSGSTSLPLVSESLPENSESESPVANSEPASP